MHEVNVEAYLADVITRIAGMKRSELPDLLPDRWQAQQPAGSAP